MPILPKKWGSNGRDLRVPGQDGGLGHSNVMSRVDIYIYIIAYHSNVTLNIVLQYFLNQDESSPLLYKLISWSNHPKFILFSRHVTTEVPSIREASTLPVTWGFIGLHFAEQLRCELQPGHRLHFWKRQHRVVPQTPPAGRRWVPRSLGLLQWRPARFLSK